MTEFAEPAPGPGEPTAYRPEPAATTGHPAVDASLRELALVAAAAPADQVPAFRSAHRTLQETLAAIDEE